MPLHDSWKPYLEAEIAKPYMVSLKHFLREEEQAGATVYPPKNRRLQAFHATPFENVRVVILGQDPYHNPNQAMGLAFSVPQGVAIPPSLQNIYKEVAVDCGQQPHASGDLTRWATQGVLLLNSVLTVRAHQPASHQGKGWEQFTDCAIQAINQHKQQVVFLLWGSYAHKKGMCIDTNRHLVLKAPHPSPLSAHRGFFGCRHFSKTNNYLKQHGLNPIDWL